MYISPAGALNQEYPASQTFWELVFLQLADRARMCNTDRTSKCPLREYHALTEPGSAGHRAAVGLKMLILSFLK